MPTRCPQPESTVRFLWKDLQHALDLKNIIFRHRAPAVAAVKAGDTVKAGDVVGSPAENALSLPVHASVNGVVAEVTDKYVLIEAK